MPATANPLIATLVEAFRAAKAAGIEAGQNTEDGGTCNLDFPAFRIDGVRAAVIRAAAEEAGVTVDDFNWFGGRRWWSLGGFLQGQANWRMRISSAADKALREALKDVPGAHVCEYQQMD